MAKKVMTVIKLQIPGGAGQPCAAGGPGAGPARREHHGVLQGLQRPDHEPAGPDSAGGDNRLRGPLVHVRHSRRPRPPGCCWRPRGSRRGAASPTGRAPAAYRATRCARSPRSKMPDLNTNDLDAAMRIIEGTARSMGLEVVGTGRCRGRPRELAGEDRKRMKVKRRSRRYRENLEKMEPGKLYTPYEAVELIKEMAGTEFDETFEAAIRLGVDPRRADQMVRGTVMLPRGTGKEITVAVFALGDKASEAEKAGADFVGGEDLVEKVQGGWTEFDAAIATPDAMSMVGKLGKILGPRGPDAEPQERHGDLRHREGRPGHQGRQDRVPGGQAGERPPGAGQGLVLRGGHTGELPGGPGGAHQGPAGRGQRAAT